MELEGRTAELHIRITSSYIPDDIILWIKRSIAWTPTNAMKNIEARADFDPAKEIPSLKGKVLFITGGTRCNHLLFRYTQTDALPGTAGIGAETARTLAAHEPSQIYITGRNRAAAEKLVAEIHEKHPAVGMTFIQADFSSLRSVKENVREGFKHDRLDVLMCTAGIMAYPATLSEDKYGYVRSSVEQPSSALESVHG